MATVRRCRGEVKLADASGTVRPLGRAQDRVHRGGGAARNQHERNEVVTSCVTHQQRQSRMRIRASRISLASSVPFFHKCI
jgi:hypothetical protein